jgi:pimeloyl-ACP methyl ester carboxylesterase
MNTVPVQAVPIRAARRRWLRPLLPVAAWLVLLALTLPRQAQLGQPKPPAPPTVKPSPVKTEKEKKPVAGEPAPPVPAKPAAPPVPAEKPTPGKTAETKDEGPPEPQRMFLDTKDGWKINCLYYPPRPKLKKGTEVVPIIAIHGWGGQGGEYSYLATGLQMYGHAVVVPDLRGHGRSTTKRYPNNDMVSIKFDSLPQADIQNMGLDIETVKKFLLQKNNDGEVNIEMLTVIAADVSSIVALNWSVSDWSWPVTTAGKQGQDVKALVLLSPVLSYKKLNANSTLTTPTISRVLSLMIAVGEKDRKALSEASRIHSRIEKLRPPLSKDPKDKEEVARKKDLFLIKAETDLQGTKLLDRQLPVNGYIVRFIDLRLVMQRDLFPWAERRSVLSGN